jgi:pilus assembly protein Flp/PilA
MLDRFTQLHQAAWSLWRRLSRSEQGASLVEYALLLALIAIVCLVAVQFIGDATNSQYSSVGSSLRSA